MVAPTGATDTGDGSVSFEFYELEIKGGVDLPHKTRGDNTRQGERDAEPTRRIAIRSRELGACRGLETERKRGDML